MVMGYALIHGLLTLLCIAVAIRRLRTAVPEPVLHPITVRSRLVPISAAIAMPEEPEPVPVHASPSLASLPPVSDHPLLWKELVHDPPAPIAPARVVVKRVGAAVLFGAVFVWALMLAGWLLQRLDGHALLTLNYLLRGLGILLALVWCVGLAFRTASSISRERDRATLGMLLTLPVDRDALLRAKWLGGILRLRTTGFLLAGVWTFGLLIGAFHPLGVLLLAGSCAIDVVFLASLGVWLSAACRKTLWAQLSMTLILLAMLGGSWLYLLNQTIPLEFTSEPGDEIGHFYEVGLNPLAVWWVAGFSWSEWDEAVGLGDELFRARLHAILYGLAIFGATAGLFWLAARRRMRDQLEGGDRLHGRSHS